MQNALLDTLLADDEIRTALAWPLDFDLAVKADDANWFTLDPAAETRAVARHGTGGLFLLYASRQHVLHVTSEGQAGLIARDLDEALWLIAEHPYWRDLLKFSGGGQLHEMRRAVPHLERELQEDFPEVNEVRALLKHRLAPDARRDAIAALHESVSRSEQVVRVAGPDGGRFKSLFNTFTVESNPMWRRP